MQRWQDEFSKHPIHSALEQLQSQAELPNPTIDPANVAERARFTKVVKMMRRAIAGIDVDLAPIDTLNQLLNSLQAHGVVNTMSTYSQSLNSALLQQANAQINPSISYVYQLANMKSSKTTHEVDLDVATANLESFSNAMAKEYEKVTRTTSVGVEKIETSIAEILTGLERARTLERSLQSVLVDFEKKATESKSQQASDFSTAQDKRQTDFSNLLNDLRASGEQQERSIFEKLSIELEEKKSTADEKLRTLMCSAEEKYSSILELYKLSAKDSVSGGHKSIADRELKAADLWRWVTIGSVIIALVWVWSSYHSIVPIDEPDRVFWIKLAKSVSFTALLLSVAVYASRQSTLHRLNERKARAFSLKVQAFDPFIASLPDDVQSKLKEEMSRRIFSADESHEQDGSRNLDFESLDNATLQQVLPMLSGKK